MKVIQVIFAVASSKYIHFFVVSICSVHVARPGRNSLHLKIQPSEIFQIQDM